MAQEQLRVRPEDLSKIAESDVHGVDIKVDDQAPPLGDLPKNMTGDEVDVDAMLDFLAANRGQNVSANNFKNSGKSAAA